MGQTLFSSPWVVAGLAATVILVLGSLALLLATSVYKHIVTFKYLFSGWKAIVPVISALPAALGVFLLVLVFAIMDGFANETREMTRGTLSDIIVDSHLEGLPYYDEYITRIRKIDGVEAATPVVQTFALAGVTPHRERYYWIEENVKPMVRPCQLIGIRPDEKAEMGRFTKYLQEQKDGHLQAATLLAVPAEYQKPGVPPRSGCIAGTGLIGTPQPIEKTEWVLTGWGRRVLAGMAAVAYAIGFVAIRRFARRGRTPILLWILAAAVAGLATASFIFLPELNVVLKEWFADFWTSLFTLLKGAKYLLMASVAGAAAVFMFSAIMIIAKKLLGPLPHSKQMVCMAVVYVILLVTGIVILGMTGNLSLRSADLLALALEAVLVVPLFVIRDTTTWRKDRVLWVGLVTAYGLFFFSSLSVAVFYPVRDVPIVREQVVDWPLVDYGDGLVISTIPLRPSGAMELDVGGVPKVSTRTFALVDSFKSGYWEADSTHVYVDFKVAQQMAGMDARPAEGSKPAVPARASQIQVKIKDPKQGRAICEELRKAWKQLATEREVKGLSHLAFNTWEDQQKMILTVVEVEKNVTVLMLSLMFLGFGVLIALISYVMAFIKSRDVGILKAVGARDAGVGSLFLGYGFIIGLVGMAAGMAAALLVVHNLDAIELWVNATLGIDIFPRDMYYFDHIPRNLSFVWCVCVGASVLALSTLASLAGGLLAALKQPVEALRYE
jgi:ABC-type lipoprotein release transport system permease subunit